MEQINGGDIANWGYIYITTWEKVRIHYYIYNITTGDICIYNYSIAILAQVSAGSISRCVRQSSTVAVFD